MAASVTSSKKPEKTAENGKAHEPSKSPALYLLPSSIEVVDTRNIRTVYEEQEIVDLAESVKADNGLLTPLTVWEYEPGKFRLNSGYRRMRALAHLKWSDPVPVMVKRYASELDAALDNTTENANRRDVRSFDQARRFHYFEKGGFSPEFVALRTGYSKSHVFNLLRAFKQLHPTILEFWSNDATGILPSPFLISLSAKTQDAQLVRFEEWKALKESKAQAKAARQAVRDGESLASDSDEQTTGASVSREVVPPSKKRVSLMLESIGPRIKEAEDEGEKAKLKAYRTALQWVTGKRATL